MQRLQLQHHGRRPVLSTQGLASPPQLTFRENVPSPELGMAECPTEALRLTLETMPLVPSFGVGHRALPSCTILGQVESCPHRGHSGTRPVSFKARKWPSHREPQHLPWPPGLLRAEVGPPLRLLCGPYVSALGHCNEVHPTQAGHASDQGQVGRGRGMAGSGGGRACQFA